MKTAALLAVLLASLALAGPAGAQDPLDPPSPSTEAEPPMPPDVAATVDRLTDQARDRAAGARAAIARRHRHRPHLTGAFARAAHFSYTWPVVSGNLVSTNEDRACGWGTNQYCYGDSKRNVWWAWVGDHSVKHEAIWAQYTYCLPGCDYADSCAAIVRTVDHNDGGRVNIRQNYYWTHKESSCTLGNLDSGPISLVP